MPKLMLQRTLIVLAGAMALAPGPARADIARGKETDRAWPWMASVKHGRHDVEQDKVGTLCGATMLTPLWAITAAHCIEAPEAVEPHVLYLVIGRHTWNDPAQGEAIQARRVIVHPEFDPTAQFRGAISGSDIALVELERPAATDGVKIAGPGEEPLWAPGTPGTILGWGTMEDGHFSYDLMEAELPIATDEWCARKHPNVFEAETMICASDPERGTGTCSGDSGGPLLVTTASGSHRQVGVTSWGTRNCGERGMTSAYARVAGPQLRNWIASLVPDAIGTPEPVPASPPSAPPSAPPPAPAAHSNTPAKPKTAKRRRSERARRREACLRRARTRAAQRRCSRRYRAPAR